MYDLNFEAVKSNQVEIAGTRSINQPHLKTDSNNPRLDPP